MRTLLKSTTHPDTRHVHVETGDPEGEVWINVCHDDHDTAAGAFVRADQILEALDAVPKGSSWGELVEQCGQLAQEHRAALERAEAAEAKLAELENDPWKARCQTARNERDEAVAERQTAEKALDDHRCLTNNAAAEFLDDLAGWVERQEFPVVRLRIDGKKVMISEWLRAAAACLPYDKPKEA